MNFLFKFRNRGVSVDVRRFPVFMTIGEILVRARIDLVIDVGANQGQFIRQIRSEGYAGGIAAFEPLKKEVGVIARDHRAPKTRVYNFALGSTASSAVLRFDPGQSCLASLHSPTAAFLEEWKEINRERVTVDVKRLDDVWPELGAEGKRVFLKIDTQGHDFEVLQGAEKSLAHIVGIQTELSMRRLYEGQKMIVDVIEYLRQKDFYLRHLFPLYHSDKTGEMFEADGHFFRPEVL